MQIPPDHTRQVLKYWSHDSQQLGSSGSLNRGPDLEVIKLEFILKLKVKCNDWLLADTCPQAANHCAHFITSRPDQFYQWQNRSICLSERLLSCLTVCLTDCRLPVSLSDWLPACVLSVCMTAFPPACTPRRHRCTVKLLKHQWRKLSMSKIRIKQVVHSYDLGIN